MCEIIKYMERKTSLSVTIERMLKKRAKDYDVYKIFVPKHLDLFVIYLYREQQSVRNC